MKYVVRHVGRPVTVNPTFKTKTNLLSAALLAITLSACGGSKSSGDVTSLAQSEDPSVGIELPTVVVPDPSPTTTSSPVAEDPNTIEIEALPQVLVGWLEAYSKHIQAKVSDNYPAMLEMSDARMATVCPLWRGLSRAEREKFWSSLIYGIAARESAYRRNMIYRESTMSTDRVTGQQIRSEGLLQLSYVDVSNYRYPSSEISWTKDKAMALADYASGTKTGNVKRTIFNAYANLNLGLFIMNRLVTLRPTEKLEASLGRYWSTMRASGSSFKAVVKSVRAKSPECF